MNQKPTDDLMKLRDAIIMAIYHTTDLNTADLARLTVRDVDIEAGCLLIRGASGILKVRLQDRTMRGLAEYIRQARTPPEGLGKGDAALFVSVFDAEPMTATHLHKTIKYYLSRGRTERQPEKGG